MGLLALSFVSMVLTMCFLPFDEWAMNDEKLKSIAATIKANNLETIKELISKENLPFDKLLDDQLGITLLMLAAGAARNPDKNYLPLIQYLIDNGAVLNQKDSQGWTAFRWVTKRNGISDKDYLDKLLTLLSGNKQNSYLNDKDQSGDTPLVDALKQSSPVLVNWLLDNKADVMSASDASHGRGVTALMLAVNWGDEDIIKKIVQAGGASMGNQMIGGWPHASALANAAQLGRLDIVELLLPTAPAYIKNDALFNIAIKSQKLVEDQILLPEKERRENIKKIIELLIQQGADLWSDSPSGEDPLTMAIDQGTDDYIARILVDQIVQRGQTSLLDKPGTRQTPLMKAAQRGFDGLVKLLIQRGVNINKKDSKGKTALMYAAERNHLETVRSLINAGADETIRDDEGKTMMDYLKQEDANKVKIFIAQRYQGIITDNLLHVIEVLEALNTTLVA